MKTKEISFAPGYFVTDKGDVISCRRTIAIKLKPLKNEKGYLRVDINEKRRRIHRLVAEAFIPNPKNLTEINHKDSNKENNDAKNLEWCTHKDNMIHAESNKRINHPIGEKHGLSKLKAADIIQIRALYVPRKVSHRILAERFECSQSTISTIVRNKTWRHI